MQIKVFGDIDDPFLKSEWERIETENDIFPQSCYHWCSTWWKYFADKRVLNVVTLIDESGKITTIVPLCIERVLGIRILRSFPINYCDFFQIIHGKYTNSGSSCELLYGYLAQYCEWDIVILSPLSDASLLYSYLNHKHVPNKRLSGNIVADISFDDWKAYLKQLSHNRRRRVKRIITALECDHRVVLEMVGDRFKYFEIFDRIYNIIDARATKDRLRRSDIYMQCVRETNGHLFENGKMALYLVKADGVIITYRIGILHGATFYDWNTSYDINYSNYSPGETGLVYVLRDLIERGYKTLDFMSGVYDYKISYSPKHEMRNNYLFIMRNRSIRAFLFYHYQMTLRDKLKAAYHCARRPIIRAKRLVGSIGRVCAHLATDLRNRVRQYGVGPSVLQLVRAGFRFGVGYYRASVFLIPNFEGMTYQDPCIALLTHERLKHATAAGEIDLKQSQLLNGFLDEGALGVYAQIDGKFAGYAFVQMSGNYTYGRSGQMTIPSGYAIVKNLFINPIYRGRQLGQKLNVARLALISKGVTPVGFIIPENRYAIRNWEKYGFRKVISVVRWRFFNGRWKTSLKRLSDSPLAGPLLKALAESKHVQ